jgi:glycosyltransferase involved in cell wall biosynthesis
MLDKITPVILTFDEAPNIVRALERLTWARQIVVLDSGSADGTVEAARAFPGVCLRTRHFDSHAQQWNAAIGDASIATEWVLALDADYMVTPDLSAELASLDPPDAVSGYRARFQFAMDGAVLRGSLYPPHVVLFRRQRGHYVQDGHTQRLVLDGEVHDLEATIVHDDRKPMRRWLASQRAYAGQEAERLRSIPWSEASARDRVRKLLVLAPWAVPAYTLFGQGVVLDGWSGVRYAAQRAIAETLIARELGRALLRSKGAR